MKRSLLIVAGEVSGDMHAAAVLRELKARDPEWSAWGVGGDSLRNEGMEVLYHVDDMAVMGLAEVLRRYGFFRRAFRQLLKKAEQDKPDAVLLVDYPGFNLRFAKQAKRRGLRVFYYICPQVWAWRRSRIPRMAQWMDRLFTIFPFEPDVFKDTPLRVDFVGHPLIREAEKARQEPEMPLPWGKGARLALLPGSRRQEIQRILPALVGAVEQGPENERPTALIAAPHESAASCIRETLEAHGREAWSDRIVVGQTRQVLRQARAALVTSGTATLEAALLECPMVVVYKTSWLTYLAARSLVQVDHIGMVNIVAGKSACPERIQGAATPDALAEAVRPLLADSPERRAMLTDLRNVKQKLGPDDPAAQVAGGLLEECAP